MSAEEIRKEYESIFNETIDESLIEELLREHAPEDVRRLLGTSIVFGETYKQLRDLEENDQAFIRFKVLKKFAEKDVKGKHIKIYVIGDRSGYSFLTDRSGADIQEGKAYVAKIRAKRKVYLGNVEVFDVYLFDSNDIHEVIWDADIGIEEFEIDPRPFAAKPFIASIEGVVSYKYSRTLRLKTDAGEVFVYVSPDIFSNVKEGDRIRLINVHPAKRGLEASIGSYFIKLGTEEVKTQQPQEQISEIRGVVIHTYVGRSSRNEDYVLYVVYDGDRPKKLFSWRTSEPAASVGDLVNVKVTSSRGLFTVRELNVVSKGFSETVKGVVEQVTRVSDYSPKYMAKLENAIVFLDNPPREGFEVTVAMTGNELDGVLVGRGSLLEDEDIGTVVQVSYQDGYSVITLHTGEGETTITLEGDYTELENRDVRIIRNDDGDIIDLKPV